MRKFIPTLLALLIMHASGSAKSEKLGNLVTEKSRYAIVDMTSGSLGRDSTVTTYAVLSSKLAGTATSTALKWQQVSPKLEDMISRGVRRLTVDKKGFIDSLSYASWDMCSSEGIDQLFLFYYVSRERVKVGAVLADLLVSAAAAATYNPKNPSNTSIPAIGQRVTPVPSSLQLNLVVIDLKTNRVTNKVLAKSDSKSDETSASKNEEALKKLSDTMLLNLGVK